VIVTAVRLVGMERHDVAKGCPEEVESFMNDLNQVPMDFVAFHNFYFLTLSHSKS